MVNSSIDKKTPVSLAKMGWSVVDPSNYNDLPSEVAGCLAQQKYQLPKNDKEKLELWKKLERLFYRYSRQFSEQYNVDYEDIAQETYVFFEKLLSNYQPLYRRVLRDSEYRDESKRANQVCTVDDSGYITAWRFYRLEAYINKNMFHKVRDYAQKGKRYNDRIFGPEMVITDDDTVTDSFFENIIHHLSESDTFSEMTYLSVERRLLNKTLEKILDEIIVEYRPTKRQVAELFFKKGLSEQEIYKILGKSQGTINSHISVIKKHMKNHPKIKDIFSEFELLGVTQDDILS